MFTSTIIESKKIFFTFFFLKVQYKFGFAFQNRTRHCVSTCFLFPIELTTKVTNFLHLCKLFVKLSYCGFEKSEGGRSEMFSVFNCGTVLKRATVRRVPQIETFSN